MESFDARLEREGLGELRAAGVELIQVNLGALCNQRCTHCHAGAGPDRAEVMGRDVMERVIEIGRAHSIPTLDVTGGAPELHPRFEPFIREAAEAFARVIVRSNLTAFLGAGRRHYPRMWRELGVEVMASLPCYTAMNVDGVRGRGVYERSIEGLRLLDEAGYGRSEPPPLVLVYNPAGPALPADERSLEADYRRELRAAHGLEFDRLIALANAPLGRFLERLRGAGGEAEYRELLEYAFNPATVPELMCRTFVSVGWDGRLYDCDFNQILGLELDCLEGAAIERFDPAALAARRIRTGPHCYTCTAGRGSSCKGALA